MRISKMLGATMVAGALATGGAAAGIAGAAAAPTTTSAPTGTGSGDSSVPVASTSTTPTTPAPAQKSATPKGTSPGKDPCPHTGSAGRPRSAPGAGSSYEGSAPAVTAQ